MTIQDAMQFYKDNFTKCWKDEKYKWIAVAHFQKNWDIEASDFSEMVTEAFSRAGNLLAGGMYYAYGMLCELAKQDSEKMRSLFRTLYNEDLPLGDHLNTWWATCDELHQSM